MMLGEGCGFAIEVKIVYQLTNKSGKSLSIELSKLPYRYKNQPKKNLTKIQSKVKRKKKSQFEQ